MASKKRTDVVNELATELNPTNEEETMNESVDKTLETTIEALANILPPPVEQYTVVEVICHGLSELEVDELKEVIQYCQERIEELQRDEVEELEYQMRAIQDKLLSLKGKTRNPASSGREGAKKQARPIVNPNDPTQVYTFGKRPEWLKTLLEAANGDKNKELEMMEAMRAK
jgi:DNA-binding protein H-NS